MGQTTLLKISEMAQLADTTRRTLIFYDEAGVFCPTKKSAAGYRYYEYNQLYDLLFILGLRKLGMSVAQVKDLQDQAPAEVDRQLSVVQRDIDQKITELTRIQTIVAKKVNQQATADLALDTPTIRWSPRRLFWCSPASASCTEEEVAELFASFYQQLDSLALMDTGQSGFLTDLADAEPTGYADAAFRVVKEATLATTQRALPRVEKPAGDFAVIRVENTTVGITRGLAKLQAFCHQRSLSLASDLWQMNLGNDALSEHGGSQYGQLEYLIKK